MKTGYARRFAQLAFGLTLAFVVALGAKLSADSGGFYCGYGDCSLTYDCENEDYSSPWSYTNQGNGYCRISVGISSTNHCYIYLDAGAGWKWVDVTGSTAYCDGFGGGSWCEFYAEPIIE